MAIKKGNVPVKAAQVDVSTARKAFDALQSQLSAISKNDLLVVRIDVQAAAAVAHSIAVRDSEGERHQAFERLAKTQLFDMTALDSLGQAALAAWHARQQQLAVGASSRATIPLDTISSAQEVRKRMLKLLEYYFDDHEEIGPQLSVIRSGRGHLDLANDLDMVADVYDDSEVRALISRDPKHYRDDDPRAARGLAEEIFKSLGLSPANASATETTQRAWTLLSGTYDKVRHAGRFLFADQEDVDVTYPSLVGYVRSTPARSGAGGEEPGTAGQGSAPS